MNASSLLFTARQSFQAARRLQLGGPEPILHGHGFEVRAVADGGACRPAFPGDESGSLEQALAHAVAPLDYALVNDHVDSADDADIAAWIRERLAAPAPVGLHLRSAPDRGVALTATGARHAWRRFGFEAAHRLPNVPEGHKCGRMHGHGFEAIIRTELGRGRNAVDGQRRIAEAWQPLRERLHRACLNDITGLENPTSEVIARWILHALDEALPDRSGVTVMETGSAGCHFDGHGWHIWKSMSFDSAVRLARAPAEDRRRALHGHTYTTRLHLSGTLDEVLGWVHDYGDVKRRFDPLFGALDHQPLHEHPALADNDPATIARHIAGEMAENLHGLSRVDVLDSAGRGALLEVATGATPASLP